MTENRFLQYAVDYISGVMSLRAPQRDSLKILETITENVALQKGMKLDAALGAVKALYPTCTDFERDFMSLTFALATGVGKTRLMGAFIAYLYTNRNIRNFFVVAPNTTIYDKLRRDLTEGSSDKYVFKGLGCFSLPPEIITDDDYKNKTMSLRESDIRIFIYNIDKFNKENAGMRKMNERIGDSFYNYLSRLDDLVVIMDESHHYRAERGMKVLDELKPLLGIELTATPVVTSGAHQTKFKNVVFEYPLSQAIADGYTRTPYAVTRSGIDFFNFGDEQIDRMMLSDGVLCHENTKRKLEAYAKNNGVKQVKPFMLVVCKDTDHAAVIEKYVKSQEFYGGRYAQKTLVVHSKQKGAESDENMRLLLGVENPDNPIEIVIHVNKLKEGWDVNNLYTIVPLRTAASKVLREQMVGRGLRLPYGERTGECDVDAVMLTAHDKFQEILDEAQSGESVFKAGNIIQVKEIEHEKVTVSQLSLGLTVNEELNAARERMGFKEGEKNDQVLETLIVSVKAGVQDAIQTTPEHTVTDESRERIVREAVDKISADKDLAEIYRENELELNKFVREKIEETHRQAEKKYIPIPRLKVTDEGVSEYVFLDFKLDLTTFNHVPVTNDILIQNLDDMSDRTRVKGGVLTFDGYNLKKIILGCLLEKPEIDYEKCCNLLAVLISTVCAHYESRHGRDGMMNVIMMNKRDIADKIYTQMMKHLRVENGLFKEEVVGTGKYNLRQSYNYTKSVDIYSEYGDNIRAVLFTDIKKGVFDCAKFDSRPELLLARILEGDDDVVNWLRPAPKEFNLTYNHGCRYEPDFVIETEKCIYLVEVKGEDRIEDEDVVAKKERGISFCEIASKWGLANNYKEWRYLFIPANEVRSEVSIEQYVQRFAIRS